MGDFNLRDFIKHNHDPSKNEVFRTVFICDKHENTHSCSLELEYLWRSQYPNETVIRINGEDFITSVIRAAYNGDFQKLKEAYNSADLLIFEDADEIAGKMATMEIAYIIIDYLLEHGRSIFFTAKCLPREMPSLEDRNRAQFEGCLIYNLRDETGFTLDGGRGDKL